jgi:hypothetical protein
VFVVYCLLFIVGGFDGFDGLEGLEGIDSLVLKLFLKLPNLQINQLPNYPII